jgi:hypothetical protein
MGKKKLKKKANSRWCGQHQPTVKELLAIGKRFRKLVKGPIMDHAELLYDEKGLPK